MSMSTNAIPNNDRVNEKDTATPLLADGATEGDEAVVLEVALLADTARTIAPPLQDVP